MYIKYKCTYIGTQEGQTQILGLFDKNMVDQDNMVLPLKKQNYGLIVQDLDFHIWGISGESELDPLHYLIYLYYYLRPEQE